MPRHPARKTGGLADVGGWRVSLRAVVVLVLLLLVGVSPSASASVPAAVSPHPIDPERYVVGGCAVAFDAYGSPRLKPSLSQPCIGARSVTVTPMGDVNVLLTDTSRLPVIRLFVSVSTPLAWRGIAAGASNGNDTVAVRLYDDLLGRRLDLRRSDDRRRLASAGGQITVGWTKAAPVGSDGQVVAADPGINALGAYHDLATTDAETVQGGCVVRFETGMPRIHANAAHICVGVRSVEITSMGKLAVNLTPEQRGSVVNAQADPDDTLTSRGIIMGTAGGLAAFHYQFYDSRLNRPLNLNSATDRARLAGPTSNVWLTWTKTAGRPGAINASQDPGPDTYGPYMNASSEPGSVIQTGCTIRFAQVDGQPYLSDTSAVRCTGVESVWVTSTGAIAVATSAEASAPVISTTTVSSRTVTDYGVRAGLSGGSSTSAYALYSLRLGRVLDLRKQADRAVLQRSGSWLSVGWSRPRM